ncbi:hypothetical protein BXY70_0823 [Roseovarius halotolerans]|uniref:Uncharacterized protein n=1 Tax=Roseovarius halotolerans TaxID=505353 RepID=A0A1X6YF02_9RHOB|nr:hypothetical protein BXY70_0823 [Roseovarius halotolerans]SLN18518.1 hypothetical protein ROH8110_00574 [Roseovarius halotolerans]
MATAPPIQAGSGPDKPSQPKTPTFPENSRTISRQVFDDFASI